MLFISFNKLPNTKAWKLTSELVRRQSQGICYTCNGRFEFEKLVAGHLIEKRGNVAIYFNLNGLRAQCMRCNRILHGAKDIYALKLIKEIGIEKVNELYIIAQKSKVWTKEELNDIVKERESIIAQL